MKRSELFQIIDSEGLLGLYRRGLFDPISCEYGGAFKDYWEHCGLAPLMGQRASTLNQSG
jgi:hypothetical protein